MQDMCDLCGQTGRVKRSRDEYGVHGYWCADCAPRRNNDEQHEQEWVSGDRFATN